MNHYPYHRNTYKGDMYYYYYEFERYREYLQKVFRDLDTAYRW